MSEHDDTSRELLETRKRSFAHFMDHPLVRVAIQSVSQEQGDRIRALLETAHKSGFVDGIGACLNAIERPANVPPNAA